MPSNKEKPRSSAWATRRSLGRGAAGTGAVAAACSWGARSGAAAACLPAVVAAACCLLPAACLLQYSRGKERAQRRWGQSWAEQGSAQMPRGAGHRFRRR